MLLCSSLCHLPVFTALSDALLAATSAPDSLHPLPALLLHRLDAPRIVRGQDEGARLREAYDTGLAHDAWRERNLVFVAGVDVHARAEVNDNVVTRSASLSVKHGLRYDDGGGALMVGAVCMKCEVERVKCSG